MYAKFQEEDAHVTTIYTFCIDQLHNSIMQICSCIKIHLFLSLNNKNFNTSIVITYFNDLAAASVYAIYLDEMLYKDFCALSLILSLCVYYRQMTQRPTKGINKSFTRKNI